MTNFYWCAGIWLAAFLTFRPAIHDQFCFDDVGQVRNLEPARGFSGWLRSAGDRWWPEEKHKTIWRPVARMTILAEKSFALKHGGADSSRFYRRISIFLHAVVSVLIFLVARSLGFSPFAAGAGGLILAMHPLRCEAVHQIVGQAELLSALFMLVGLLDYLRARRRNAAWWRIAASQSILYALALGAKEHAVLYPLFPLLIEWIVLIAPGEPRRSRLRRAILLWIPLALICVLYLGGKYAVTGGLIEPRDSVPDYENVMARVSFLGRIPASLGILGYAVSKFFVPLHLSPDYSAESLPIASGWAWPMTWAGVIILMVCVAWGGSNYRRGGQGWALVIAGLISYGFISNLFFTHGVALAARLWYFPMIAAGLGAGFAFSRIPNRRGAALILVALTLVLASSSWKFSRAWRTERSLAEATLRVFPRCWRANYNLSRECYLEKDFKQGADAAKLAAELRPDDPMSWDYLGLNAMFMDGREGEAEEAFKKEIALDPKTAHAYKNLSNLMKKSGRADEAAAYLQDYLRLKSP